MEENSNKPKRVNIRMIIVLIVLALFIITELITNRAEYLKIKEIGSSYTSIFFTNFYMKYIVFGISFLVAYILFYINNKIIRRGMKHFFAKEGREVLKLPNKSVSLIMGLISGICSSKFLYTKLITCMNASYFGIYDEVFGKDIGYYMFILPFIKTLLIFLLVSSLIMVIYTAVYYVISINVCFKNGVDLQDLKESTFVKQIKFWAIVFGAIMSLYLLVTAQDILTRKYDNN